MKYKYSGLTKQKQKVNGVVDAEDELEARYKLRAMQIRPTNLQKVNAISGINIQKLNEISIGKPIDLKGMLIFTRQFSSLIDAGVPVVQCLDILAQQEKRPPFKRVLIRVKESIEAGNSLAESLSSHKNVFSGLFISLVEAGEVSGTLEVTLRRIGSQLEKTDKIRSKVKGAMIYPVITLIVSVFVLIFLLVKVIPEVSKLYQDSKAQLPEITQKVLALSYWVQANYSILVQSIIGGIVFFAIIMRIEAVRRFVDPLLLMLPLFGPLIKKSAITRFSRTMATLVSSGVPLLTAFEICAKLMSNYAIQNVITQTAQVVSEGKSVAFGLSQTKIFPPMVVHMVSIGEVTGKLDELLSKVADIYEDEVDEAVNTMTGMIQPALIIVVGGLIAFLLLAMYLPIFQLAEKVSGGL